MSRFIYNTFNFKKHFTSNYLEMHFTIIDLIYKKERD